MRNTEIFPLGWHSNLKDWEEVSVYLLYCFWKTLISEGECIEVILKNDALAKQREKEDIYEESENVNGRRSWKSTNHAIWFLSEQNKWVIGKMKNIGSDICGIASPSGAGDYGYPYDVPRHQWEYYIGFKQWKKPTNDAEITIRNVTGTITFFDLQAKPQATFSSCSKS